MKKLHIGIDIDNTIADSFPHYLAKFNEYFKMSVKMEDVADFYHLEHSTGISTEKVWEFLDIAIHTEEFQIQIAPHKEPQEYILRWSKHGYLIHYITARPVGVRKVTIDWLKKHGFWVAEAKLNLIDHKVGSDDIEYKNAIVRKFHIDIFIEDKKDIAEAMNIPVVLLDRKWNQGRLPPHVKRVKNWGEIDAYLSQVIPKKGDIS